MKPKRPSVQRNNNDKKRDSAGVHIHPHLKGYVGYCFYKLAMRYRAMTDQELQAYHVVAPQCGILAMLSKVGCMTQVELGSYMAIDKASMVRLLDGLEEKGFLVRGNSQGDRRAKVLAITKAGERVFERMNKARRRAETKFLSPLTDAERETFKEILLKLAD